MNFLDIFQRKIILITGGTGSIGIELVKQLLQYNPKTIRILSNSEHELWETRQLFSKQIQKLRFLLGDIRNFERMKRATQDVDIIINASDVKHVPLSEYNPIEAINVNIHGLNNIIEAAFVNNVVKLIHLSTDKAINPTTVMGATKMLSERLCLSREMAKGKNITSISSVRFGNVLGSRGSIIPLIKEQIRNGNEVTLTDEKMKRFFMSIEQAARLILKSIAMTQGGEIFVLKMPVVWIKDLIEIIIEEYCPQIGKDPKQIKIKTIGPRLGEKLDEKLISPIELAYCYETDDMFIIYPPRYFEEEHLKEKITKLGKKVDLQIMKEYSTITQKVISKEEVCSFFKEFNLLAKDNLMN
ncbi:MAG: SDR family NAD(P)-dependent oxidoreductase [Promethearchaeota archaeon]